MKQDCAHCGNSSCMKSFYPDSCVPYRYKKWEPVVNGYNYRMYPHICPYCGEKTAIRSQDDTSINGKRRYRYCVNDDCDWLTDKKNETGRRWSCPSVEVLDR